MKENIGVIGYGFVGKAVLSVFDKTYKTESFDLKIDCSCDSLDEIVDISDILFICVPTPMNDDGSCNTEIVTNVVSDIHDVIINKNYKRKTIVIKSTIPPGTSEMLSSIYKNINFVFNPEFLTEANYLEDFKNQNRIILGGNLNDTKKLERIYSAILPNSKIIKTTFKEAEMVKYFTNTFLASKVAFANEMYQLCTKLNINYDQIVKFAVYDKRLGESHFSVPGPDGKLGFGGSCFPKDLNAIIFMFKSLGIKATLLEAVWKSNSKLRPNNIIALNNKDRDKND